MDDEPDFLEQAQLFLEKRDDRLDIETTTSAEEALKMLDGGRYDAVISDYQMPGMNGLEFLEALREDRESDIPFIIFTGKGREEVAMKALNLEADRYLQKGGNPKAQYGVLAQAIVHEVERARAGEELEKSEEKYRAVFENTGTATCILEEDTTISLANARFEELSGYSKKEIEGKKSWTEFVSGEYLEKMKRYHEERRKGKGKAPTEYEFDFKDREGKVKKILLTIDMIPETKQSVASLLDITERKEAERLLKETKERFEELFEGANEMIITTDREGYVYRANKAVEEVSGYSEEELRGESILKVAHPDDHDKYIEFWKRVLNGEEPIYQLRGLSKYGKTVHLAAGGRPIIEDGEIIEIQYNAHDITELRGTQEREEFLHSLLRHDLRNKAQIAQGYHKLLKDTSLSEEQKQYLEKAENGVQESVELIDKVRMLREIEEEEVGEVRIGPIIDKVVSENESHASERGIEIEVGCNLEGKVRGGSLLKELFSNLIGNSIQHSDCDRIRISAQDQDGKYVVSVEDDGKGIPDEDKTKIFERGFKKGSSAGSGLGMFLAKGIAENSGGGIEVKNSELGGAKFDIHLAKA